MRKELQTMLHDYLSACYAEGYSEECTEVRVKEYEDDVPTITISFEGTLDNLTYALNLFIEKPGCEVWDIQGFDRYHGGSLDVLIGVYKPYTREKWAIVNITNDKLPWK